MTKLSQVMKDLSARLSAISIPLYEFEEELRPISDLDDSVLGEKADEIISALQDLDEYYDVLVKLLTPEAITSAEAAEEEDEADDEDEDDDIPEDEVEDLDEDKSSA